MSPSFSLRVVLLALCLLALPALVVAQAPPTPVPDGLVAADADARVYPPLGPAIDPSAPAPAAPAPAAPSDVLPQTGYFEEGEWTRVIYRGFDGHDYELYSVGGRLASNQMKITDTPNVEALPALSPDARHVAFVADYDGDLDVYLADYTVDGPLGAVRRLVDMPEDEYAPVWSADGTKLAFYSVGDQGEIFTVRADGSQLTRLTFDAAFDGYPTWSPDGQQIAFSSTRSGGYRIHVMNADGSNVRQVSGEPGSLYPAWSPDGRAIAYSADADGDGWLDLMVMDGGGPRRFLNSNPGTDIQRPTWSPNGQAIAFAAVYYVEYHGNFYIAHARVEAKCFVDDCEQPYVLAPDYSFDPGWGKIDFQPPVTMVPALPAESPATFTVAWRGSDVGPANLRVFEVQMQKNGGPWTAWQTETGPGEWYIQDGRGGDTYAFRSRGVDYAGNVEPWPVPYDAITRVESRPPDTKVAAIPPWTRAGALISLHWESVDPGGSGVVRYAAEFRRNGGPWTDLDVTTNASHEFAPGDWQGQPGDRFDFRVRAIDEAENVEPWPPDPGDVSTTVYERVIIGRVTDNTGTPVMGATAEVTPAALNPLISGGQGDYLAYFGPAPASAALRWAKDGYGALPPAAVALTGAGPAAGDAGLLTVLPPADDVMANGGFEADGWGAWQPGGSRLPQRVPGGHTGAAAAIGEPAPAFAARQRLTTSASYKSHVTLTMDGDDNLFALWRSSPTSDPDWNAPAVLVGAQRRADGTWLPATTLVNNAAVYDVDRDGDGRLHVVVPTGASTYVLHQSGAGWSAPEAVPGAVFSRYAKIVAGPGGRLDVFILSTNTYLHVYHYRRAANGAWSPATDLGAFGIGFQLLEVDGTVHFFAPNDDGKLVRRRLWPAGTWTAVETLPIKAPSDFAVAADAAGRLHFAWLSSSFDGQLHYRLLDNGRWGPDEVASPAIDGAPTSLSGWGLTAGGQPQALVVGDPSAYYLRRTAGGWTKEEMRTRAHYAAARMVVDAGGTPHVSYIDTADNGTYQVFYTARDDAGAWTPPQDLSQAAYFGHDGLLALDSAGNVHAVYTYAASSGVPGDLAYAGPAPAVDTGEATLSQAVAVPAGMAHPTLSFLYAGAGALRLTLDAPGRPPSVIDLPPSPAGMRHVSLPLDDAAGDTLTLRFALSQTAGRPPTWAKLDEVTLGAAHPDVWVTAASGRGTPGRTVEHTLRLGNRGAVAATGVVLTYTLPPQLTFVSATPPPSSTAPLRWNLGALPAGQQVTIVLTAAVPRDAGDQRHVTSTAAVTADAELETLNNAATAETTLESVAYVPITTR